MNLLRSRARAGVRRLAAIALGAPLCICVVARGQQTVVSEQLPDAPAPQTMAISTAPDPAQPQSFQASASQEISQAQNAPGNSATANQETPQKPVGAAAAPPVSAAGVTAARPAGAVIAPAKQRRARAILIRVGLLVGAGVALGTVLALTHATPSQPQ